MSDFNLTSIKAIIYSARPWLTGVVVGLLSTLLLFVLSKYIGASNNWPVEPVGSEHPIANTMGEIMVGWSGGVYQHPGLDILAIPYGELSAPFAVLTEDGCIANALMAQDNNYNYVDVYSVDPSKISQLVPPSDDTGCEQASNYVGDQRYRYMHLEHTSVDPALMQKYLAQEGYLAAGQKLAQIRKAFACSSSHLHYEILDSNPGNAERILNPLRWISPNPDPNAPEIKNIYLAPHGGNPWQAFPPGTSGSIACDAVVSGEVDIVVELRDRDDAGSTLAAAGNLGIYSLAWRLCPASDPDCTAWNQAHVYDAMPLGWSNKADPDARFSERFGLIPDFETVPEKWISLEREPTGCPTGENDKTFMILSAKSGTSSWDTDVPEYPNGAYKLMVRAGDIGGKSDDKPMTACVANP